MSTAVALAPSANARRELKLESLRALLPAPAPLPQGLPTGVAKLDAALACEGLPRGRLTEIVGATGKLTLLLQVVEAAVQRGEWVAFIDASRTLAPRDWAHLGRAEGVWMIRPQDAARAAWCADVLLRSAAFSLVVLDSAPPLSRAVAVRLTGLARESDAAFVIVGSASATRLGGAVRLRVNRRRQRLRIAVEKGGSVVGNTIAGQRVVEVSCANGVARRLCSHSEVPDRRGAARGNSRRGGKGQRAATPAYGKEHGGMLQFC